MAQTFTVTAEQIIKEFSLEIIEMPRDPVTILISSSEINRPGLELTGFLDFYDNKRLLVIGRTEQSFLQGYTEEERQDALDKLISKGAPGVILTRDIQPFPELIKAAVKYGMPILRTSEYTSQFISALVAYLNVELAPRVTRHGVLVEVYGEGVLLVGDSGVGKSETAIELIKRGHRLIADDAVEIRKVSNKTLVGSAPNNIRHFIELRGIGIINARRIFGVGAVKITEKIDLVINMEVWDAAKMYDRMGIDNEYTEILGNKLPLLTIPIKPGRNLAIIIEVAAMNNRQKKMGYNAAHELLRSLGMEIDDEPKEQKADWDIF
ncbi:MAG: HPr(Ser) kinase/phosphatase [Oscillospiraceae bacterium]|jgi:HPr kinase/phosphorylase|nr:HPr(Ser) kinase/phosphatase [Oscillospiraceae bacterium]